MRSPRHAALPPPPTPSRPRRSRHIRLLALATLAAVAGGGIVFALAWRDRGAEEASTDDAIRRFRDDGTRAAAAPLRPAAGVYTYDATGEERLSVLDTAQAWGPTMPATVTHDPSGCWWLEVEYSTHHRARTYLCPTEEALLEHRAQVRQEFDFVAFSIIEVTEFACDPPGVLLRLDAAPGDAWSQSCTGGSTERATVVTSAGTNTFVGAETLVIGGEARDALHYRMDRTHTGDQDGTEETHHWYDAEDGMLLRATHDISVASPSPIGDVRYAERGEFTLTSRTPRV